MFETLATVLQQSGGGGAAGGIVALLGFLFQLGIIAVVVAGTWKVFEKAGEDGWKVLIPIYNMYVLTKISGKDTIWFILLFVPFINFIAGALIHIDLAKKFGKGPLYGLGLFLLNFIFFPLLGFGDAQYQG